MRMTWKTTLALPVLLAVSIGGAAAGEPVSESRPVAAGAPIEIDNIAGSLIIEGWSNDSLEITGTLGSGVEELEIDVDEDGAVSIEVRYDESYRGRGTDQTELFVKLPSASPLTVETVSASIGVSGMSGEVDLETVSGAVTIDGAPSALGVESVSGPVTVASAPSGTDLESVSGRIEIASASGDLDVENVSGAIVISGGTLENVDLETVSGKIECSALPAAGGDLDLESMSGSITLAVAEGMVASYEISTFSGTISSDFGPEPRRTSTYAPGTELRFNTGQDGPNITISSFSGDIRLVAR